MSRETATGVNVPATGWVAAVSPAVPAAADGDMVLVRKVFSRIGIESCWLRGSGGIADV